MKRQTIQTHTIWRTLLGVLIPHHSNRHHPYLISRYGFLALFALLIGGFVWSPPPQTNILGDTADISIGELAQDTNQARTANNLPTLAINPRLAEAAKHKAADMFAHQYWSHDSPSGTTPWQWIDEAGYTYAYAGENLAKNFANAQTTVNAWMASPAHRDNILNRHYTEVGYAVSHGVLHDKPTTLVVAMYGQPAALAATSAKTPETSAPATAVISPVTRVGIALASLNPTMLGALTLMIIGLVCCVGTFFLTYRMQLARLPARHAATVRWRQHHTVSKFIILLTAVSSVSLLFGNGQI